MKTKLVNNLKKVWMAAVILNFCWGCTKEVVIDLPDYQTRVVVNCVINPDSIVQVGIYRSVALLDKSPDLTITNATVTLEEEGIQSVSLQYVDSVKKYVASGFKPVPGHTYQLLASAPGFEQARATCTVPETIQFSNIVVEDSVRPTGDGFYVSRIKYTLADPSLKNYYYLEGKVPDVTTQLKQIGNNLFEFDTIYFYNTLSFDTEFSTYQSTWSSGGVVFNDALFNGQIHKGSIDFYPYQGSRSNSDTRKQRFTLLFRHTDAFYYEYQRKLYLHMNNQDGGLFAGEPVNMPSNITNGYGIFAAYNQIAIDI